MPTAHVPPTHPVLHVNDQVVVLGDGEDVDAVTVQIGSEVSHRCGRCGAELIETVEGFTSDDSGPSCPDYQPDDAVSPVTDGPHVPVGVPLSWCNSAGVSLDSDADAVTVSVSVGDPRGAFVFTVRRVPDDAEGRFTGRLILHVPDPNDSSPHMRLTAIRPGTFLIGDRCPGVDTWQPRGLNRPHTPTPPGLDPATRRPRLAAGVLRLEPLMSRSPRDNTPAKSPRPKRRVPIPPGDPHRHARKIAGAVDEAWHRAHGTGDLEIPASVVAGLALLAPADGDRDEVTEHLLGVDTEAFVRVMRAQWGVFVHARPDLVVPAWPLITVWHGEHRIHERTAEAAKQVADAAVRAGQLHLTGTGRRADTDLFGALLTALRSRTDRTSRGQFYTPADVSILLAGMLGAPQAGQAVHEPAAGTGGMLRALAQAMREAGRDPAEVDWIAVDTDSLAIACLAVNTVLWRLGARVLLAVGNSLTDEAVHRTAAQRRETIDLATHLRQARTMIAALRDTETLLNPPDTP